MPKQSAGLLVFRRDPGGRLSLFLVHPGGPFWARKDDGAWSIPKGEPEPGEALQEAAAREFREETGFESASAHFLALGSFRQPSGKLVHAWAVEGDYDPATIRSNTFRMEWPPGSGNEREVPEIDRAAWFDVKEAKRKILPGQRPIIEALEAALPLTGRP